MFELTVNRNKQLTIKTKIKSCIENNIHVFQVRWNEYRILQVSIMYCIIIIAIQTYYYYFILLLYFGSILFYIIQFHCKSTIMSSWTLHVDVFKPNKWINNKLLIMELWKSYDEMLIVWWWVDFNVNLCITCIWCIFMRISLKNRNLV